MLLMLANLAGMRGLAGENSLSLPASPPCSASPLLPAAVQLPPAHAFPSVHPNDIYKHQVFAPHSDCDVALPERRGKVLGWGSNSLAAASSIPQPASQQVIQHLCLLLLTPENLGSAYCAPPPSDVQMAALAFLLFGCLQHWNTNE